MKPPPFNVEFWIPGWTLFWAELELRRQETAGDAGAEGALAALRARVADECRAQLSMDSLSKHATVAALRKLYRASGCDPTRYRPSSEALVRRLLKDGEIPAIHPIVDLNNCLSASLLAPCCVIADGTVVPPLVYRNGQPGESYESLRGPFDLAGKPVLCDMIGPFDAPITGSQRVKVTEATRRALLVSYLPSGVVAADAAAQTLDELVTSAPVAEILWTGANESIESAGE